MGPSDINRFNKPAPQTPSSGSEGNSFEGPPSRAVDVSSSEDEGRVSDRRRSRPVDPDSGGVYERVVRQRTGDSPDTPRSTPRLVSMEEIARLQARGEITPIGNIRVRISRAPGAPGKSTRRRPRMTARDLLRCRNMGRRFARHMADAGREQEADLIEQRRRVQREQLMAALKALSSRPARACRDEVRRFGGF